MRWLKPNILGLMLLALGLTGFAMLLRQHRITFLANRVLEQETAIGWPPVVRVTARFSDANTPVRTVRILWAPASLVLVTFWCFAMAIGRVAVTPGLERRAVAIIFAVLVGAAALAFVLAMLGSRLMWGYWLSRPDLDWRVSQATRVRSLTPVVSGQFRGGAIAMVHDGVRNATSVQELLGESLGQSDPYYDFVDRAVVALDRRHLLTPMPATMPSAPLAGLHARMDSAGLLEAGSSGYTDAKLLHGYVIELDGPGGEALMLVAASGYQVSNDHYPYYEVLYRAGANGDLTLLSRKRFYFDVAGMEGFEWPAMFCVFLVVEVPVAVSIALIVFGIKRWRAYKTVRQRGFAVQVGDGPQHSSGTPTNT